MIKTSIGLQDLRQRIYIKAKKEPHWRFWGLYVHVCKKETLFEGYRLAKRNRGSAGIDNQSFGEIEAKGLGKFISELSLELKTETYKPMGMRRVEIPKDNGRTRTLSIATIRDRVVQGALKLIIEPIFETDFQDGSFGYRSGRSQHQAIDRVSKAIIQHKRKVIDVDLKNFFDDVRHHILLKQIAERINDSKIMRLIKLMLKAGGNKGIAQGSVISPVFSNIYLNPIDKMLEKAKRVTRKGTLTYIEYARFADDITIIIDNWKKWEWLEKLVCRRLKQELDKLQITINRDKSKIVDLEQNGTFTFMGFDWRILNTRDNKNVYPHKTPKINSRKKLIARLKHKFKINRGNSVNKIIDEINPILRGWVNYFRIGNSTKCFQYIQLWVEKKIRRHMMKTRKRSGFGWKRWSTKEIYDMGLFNDYYIRYFLWKVAPDNTSP